MQENCWCHTACVYYYCAYMCALTFPEGTTKQICQALLGSGVHRKTETMHSYTTSILYPETQTGGYANTKKKTNKTTQNYHTKVFLKKSRPTTDKKKQRMKTIQCIFLFRHGGDCGVVFSFCVLETPCNEHRYSGIYSHMYEVFVLNTTLLSSSTRKRLTLSDVLSSGQPVGTGRRLPFSSPVFCLHFYREQKKVQHSHFSPYMLVDFYRIT